MAKRKPPKKTPSGEERIAAILPFEDRGDAIEDLFANEKSNARRSLLVTLTKMLCGMDNDGLSIMAAMYLELYASSRYGSPAVALGPPPFIRDGA